MMVFSRVLVFLLLAVSHSAYGATTSRNPLTIVLPEGVDSQTDLPTCTPTQVCSEVRPYLPAWLSTARSSQMRDVTWLPRNATLFCKCPDEASPCATSFGFDSLSGQIYNGAKLHTCGAPSPVPYCAFSTPGVLKKEPVKNAAGKDTVKIELSCRCPGDSRAVFSDPKLEITTFENEIKTVDISCERVSEICSIENDAESPQCLDVSYEYGDESQIVLGDVSRPCRCPGGNTCLQYYRHWSRLMQEARTAIRRNRKTISPSMMQRFNYRVKRKELLPLCFPGSLENSTEYFNEGVNSDDQLPHCSHPNQLCSVVKPHSLVLGRKTMTKTVTKYCRCSGDKPCRDDFTPDPVRSLIIGGKQYHTCKGNAGVPSEERPYQAMVCEVKTVYPNTEFTWTEARAGLSSDQLKPYDVSKYVTLDCKPQGSRYGATFRTGELSRYGAGMAGVDGNLTLTTSRKTDYISVNHCRYKKESDVCGTVTLNYQHLYVTTQKPAWEFAKAEQDCMCPSDSICPIEKWVKDVHTGNVTDLTPRYNGPVTVTIRCQKKPE
ncbi:uncharacterized protein LOC106154879 [Lingula anatina]|uniref:Uncharacterized protein LOC106154879 n=1 Tax=Lingula anatina TaxID=7574 RepID=A0A1S3HFP3_LINAN|nr:uncharacterized protein LOC106154879 [Lingula anatina]|eukprot:XP_013384870.1 uncharacterized protein LOC106154879 [Lingula anatina]